MRGSWEDIEEVGGVDEEAGRCKCRTHAWNSQKTKYLN